MKSRAGSFQDIQDGQTFKQTHQEKKSTPINKIKNEREVKTITTEINTKGCKSIMNNYMPTNWTIWMKFINF